MREIPYLYKVQASKFEKTFYVSATSMTSYRELKLEHIIKNEKPTVALKYLSSFCEIKGLFTLLMLFRLLQTNDLSFLCSVCAQIYPD